MEGNKYWEEQKRQYYNTISEEDAANRIKQCQLVVEKLEQDELWQIVLKDTTAWMEQIDSRWQDVYDEKQLEQMRVMKLAANQIAKMKEGYIQEWRIAQEELDRRRNPDVIEKDYEK